MDSAPNQEKHSGRGSCVPSGTFSGKQKRLRSCAILAGAVIRTDYHIRPRLSWQHTFTTRPLLSQHCLDCSVQIIVSQLLKGPLEAQQLDSRFGFAIDRHNEAASPGLLRVDCHSPSLLLQRLLHYGSLALKHRSVLIEHARVTDRKPAGTTVVAEPYHCLQCSMVTAFPFFAFLTGEEDCTASTTDSSTLTFLLGGMMHWNCYS